jgi:hypothetical protein
MRVAPLRLRLLAALVDAAALVAGMAAVVGVGIAGAVAYTRVRGENGDPYPEAENGQGDDGDNEPEGIEDDIPRGLAWLTPGRQSWQLRGAMWGASAALTIAGRNWRSPGFRSIGLRRIDASTGGVVTVRSALIGVLFGQAWQAAWRPLSRSRVERHQVRLRALAPQLRAVERKHADDPQARQRARTEFYKSNAVNPARSCGWLVVGPLVSQVVLALSARAGRTIRDRITGTAVIVDRWPATALRELRQTMQART